MRKTKNKNYEDKKVRNKKIKILALAGLTVFSLTFLSFRSRAQTGFKDIAGYTVREEGKKYIALTYDDGPTPGNTSALLDILKENDAKATFFVLGMYAELSPEILKRIVDEGNEVGNHSFNHLRLNTLNDKELTNQIEKTNKLIEGITGRPVSLLRPPYGLRNKNVIGAAKKAGMSIILWNVDTHDWSEPGAKIVANRAISKSVDGDIVLLHDNCKGSVKASEIIIKELKKSGYEFLTVSDLIHMNEGLTEGSVYRSARKAMGK